MDYWNEMALFVEVAEAQGFTKAAAKLDMPQSTLSRKISELEKSLGLQLLSRSTRRVGLTEAGARYLERVRPIVEEARRIHDELGGMLLRPHGVLRVSLPVDFSYEFLAPLLPEFAAQYPEIGLEMDVTPRKADLVGEPFDLVIRAGEQPDSGYVATLLMKADFYLYAAPTFLDKHGVPPSPQEVNPAHCLRFPALPVWRLADAAGNTAEIAAQSPYAVNSMGMLTRMAAQGLGIALVPQMGAAAQYEAEGRLQRVLPGWSAPPVPVYAMTATRLLPAKVKCFIEFVKARAGVAD
ncbi:LysR family transcriptional regulator [Eikenella sp. S3360]|uniref:LysR family transcriptional regulator n=1 Tax=Eikenella glucosivorans TaxID=2766967 RepID=A0ABS0N7D6_9NEIS|nr:LysR family transcriptional regulator [Eikenella glucosivorans]MBH5328222.1 LysR family transcriptional regulator [Eikenella glucosivorans]